MRHHLASLLRRWANELEPVQAQPLETELHAVASSIPKVFIIGQPYPLPRRHPER